MCTIVSIVYGRTDASDERCSRGCFRSSPLLEPEHRPDQVHRHDRRRDGKLKGKKIVTSTLLGLRQGTIPCWTQSGPEVRIPGHAYSGRHPGTSSSAVAEVRQIKARLGDPWWGVRDLWAVMNAPRSRPRKIGFPAVPNLGRG